VKKLITLGAMLVALATAGPALADRGQSTDHSAVTVQLGSANASPAAAANAPANANATVCVASICSNEAAPQESPGASAGSNAGSGSGSSPAGQSADESIGTVQIGSVNVDPAAAVSAPVNVNAPVCVAAACSSSNGGQQAGSATATTTNAGQSQTGNQTTHESIGTVQIGDVDVDPAAAVSAPVNADTPVCVLATCASTSGGQDGGGTGGGGGGGGTGGGGDTDGGGTGGGGGTSSGGGGSTVTTGSEPGPPAPQGGPTQPVGPTGVAAEVPASPKPSTLAGGRLDTTAAGAGVLGSGAGSSTPGTESMAARSVAAKGELPFSGLALARDLVLGLALMLVGLFTRKLSAAEGGRL
jgi:hypothetical protein